MTQATMFFSSFQQKRCLFRSSAVFKGAAWLFILAALYFTLPTLSFSQSPANTNYALQFDGTDDYVSDVVDEPETEITHEFWFKITNPDGGLFSVTESGGGHDRQISLGNGDIKTRVLDDEVLSTSGTNFADGNGATLSTSSVQASADNNIDQVTLNGYGGTTPAIGVTPDSLSASLNVGDTTTQTLVISNTGENELTYTISLKKVIESGAIRKQSAANLRQTNSVSSESVPEGSMAHHTRNNHNRTSLLAAALPRKSLSAQPRILTVNFASPDGPEALTNLGYTYTIVNEDDFATVDLLTYDLLFIPSGPNTTPLYNRAADIAAFLNSGGGLIVLDCGDLDWLPLSVVVGYCDGDFVHVTAPLHPVLSGLNDAALSQWSNSYHVTFTSYDASLTKLAEGIDCSNDAVVLAGNYGRGNILLTGLDPDLHYLYGDHSADAGTFLVNAITWAGAKWLSVSKESGTVQGGSSDTITVVFDARNIFGGDYKANVIIASNDSANPTVTVPAQLNVTGIPDIVVSDTVLNFGNVFIGDSKVDTLVVTNTGTDILTLTAIGLTKNIGKTTGSVWYITPNSATLNPTESVNILVTFTPFDTLAYSDVLTIESNDPDMGIVAIPLSGTGVYPPNIIVSPDTFAVSLSTGQTTMETLTIANDGLSDLTWSISVVDVVGTAVVAKSPQFTSSKKSRSAKENGVKRGRPDASQIYTFAPPSSSVTVNKEKPGRELQSVTLNYVLNRLNLFYTNITNVIPNMYNFSMDGEDGVNDYGISDGGDDMYDWGNQLETDLGYYLQYSDNYITGGGTILGPSGQYFTRKFPGLWVLAADIHGVEYFQITGDLGADGGGTADGSIVEVEYQGTTYRGYVKRVNDGGDGDPSVNHLIIVPYGTGVNHEFSINTNDDYHRVFGLQNTSRIYYLLFAGTEGYYYDDAVMMNVMNAFLSSLNLVETITPQPSSGVVERGTSVDVPLLIDGKSLASGTYTKNILVTSNDPDEPSVVRPLYLTISGEQDIAVTPSSIDFGDVFATGSKTKTILIINDGPDTLNVSNISIGLPGKKRVFGNPIFMTNASSAVVDPYSNVMVEVTFTPQDTVEYSDVLVLTSDDPDMGETIIPLSGKGTPPPDIDVSPTSFSVEMFQGDTLDQTLTISNLGLVDLTFNLSFEEVTVSKTMTAKRTIELPKKNLSMKKLSHVSRRDDRKKISASTTRHKVSKSSSGNRNSLAGQPSILALGFTDSGGDLLAESELNYTLVDELGFASATLSDYDVLFIASYAYTPPLYDRAADIENFVNNGGGLVVLDQGDWDWMPVSLTVSSGWCGDQVTIVAPEHPVMNGITSEGLSNWGCSLHSLFPEYDSRLEVLATGVPEDVAAPKRAAGGLPLILAGDIGRGRVVLSGEDNEHRLGNGPTDDGIEIVKNMVMWAGKQKIIRFTPKADTLSPSQSVEVTVTFSARKLAEGNYSFTILINNNDPDESVVFIPVEMNVLAAPLIAVSDSAINFGTHVIGDVQKMRTLTITNEGADTLEVYGVSVDNEKFSVDTSGFVLEPGTSQDLNVTFLTDSAGTENGTLTITSNARNGGTTTVPLTALAVLADGARKALSFDGNARYVQVPSGVYFNGDLTIEGWVYVRSYNYWSRMLDFGNGAGMNNVLIALTRGNTGMPRFSTRSAIGEESAVDASVQLPLNQWTHIAGVLQGTTGTLYINGVAVASNSSMFVPTVPTSLNYIAKSNWDDDYADAMFDEIRIWNVARSEGEIRSDMHRRLSGDQKGLVAYWRFDEESGSITYDGASVGPFNGTLFGSPARVTSTAPLGTGETNSVVGFTEGSIALGDVTITMTDAFDYPRDIYATRIMYAPNILPAGSTTLLDDRYWVINTFSSILPISAKKGTGSGRVQAGDTFAASLTFTVPQEFTNNGNADPLLYQLYSRQSTSESNWSMLIDGGSTITTTTIAFDGITSFSQFALGTNDPLPIQLSFFTASVVEGNNVQLEWTTTSEINNYGFYVERKLSNEPTFVELPNSFVKGAGTTNEEQHYSWIDKNVSAGTYFYRLKQVDLNGDFTYSHEIQVVVDGVLSVWDDGQPLEFKLLQNFPNPFNPATEIRYAIKDAGFVTLKVYNVLGQEVATLVQQEMQPGRYIARFDANALSSGLYIYRLTSGSHTVVRQMMMIK